MTPNADTPAARTPTPARRPAVLAFATAMENQLRKHDATRGPEGWARESEEYLFSRLMEETGELHGVLFGRGIACGCRSVGECSHSPDWMGIRAEAADVANFAMMIADACGALEGIKHRADHEGVAGEARAEVKDLDELLGRLDDANTARGDYKDDDVDVLRALAGEAAIPLGDYRAALLAEHATPAAEPDQGVIDQLVTALRCQHQWQLAQTEPDDEFGYVPADEYSDSDMCEQTMAALEAAADSATEPDVEVTRCGRCVAPIGRVRVEGRKGGVYCSVRCADESDYERGTPVEELASPSDAGGEWTPTSENVNALPEPVRRYIHDLETRCDLAGEVRELAIARDTIKSLEMARLQIGGDARAEALNPSDPDDAEQADAGAGFAATMMAMQPGKPEHRKAHEDLTAKRDRLLSEALALDPDRTAPAWEETTLSLSQQEPTP